MLICTKLDFMLSLPHAYKEQKAKSNKGGKGA